MTPTGRRVVILRFVVFILLLLTDTAEGERSSRNKKFCKKRRQLRDPSQRLGRCDGGQHRRCQRLPTCFAPAARLRPVL